MGSRARLATVLVAVLMSACTSSPGVTPRPTTAASAAMTPAPASTGVQATATPAPTLPGGLEPRMGRPPLIDGEAAACIPECGEGRTEGGMLPTGRYQTEWFFGGYMTLETDGTWERGEDSNGELGLPIAPPEGIAVYQVAFFLDPVLVVQDIDQEVSRNATAYVEWLAAHEHLVVSEPILTKIGEVPALAVDIHLAPDAPSDYDDCPPDPCVAFIKVAAFDHSDGVLGDDEYRFYFADIRYSGSHHILAVKVEGRDPADLDAQLPSVERLLETVVIPAKAAPPALVGNWLGFHNCERIMAIMTAAGMPGQGLLNVAESGTLAGVTTVDQIEDPKHPCVGAVDQKHSHFFTADGVFGSRDMHDAQVDDGVWGLVDADTLSISGTPFDFQVDGDKLRLQAVDVGTCPVNGQWCPEAWKLMVAMPGMTWTRDD